FVYNGMVYVVLQRYDVQQFSAGVPVLITIDPATDTIVDMDEDEEGIQGIDLNVRNPQEGSLNGSILYLAGTTYGASDEGVIIIDLENPLQSQKKIVSEEAAGGFITGVDVFIAEYGLVYVYDENWMEIGRTFNIQDGTLGEPVPFPDAGGGVIMVDGLLYVCSRDFENPGLHIFSPFTDEAPPMHEFYPTELPPYTIAYVGEEEPVVTSITKDEPGAFILEAPYPNPFNPSTTVSFTIPEPNPVCVEVFNTAGQKVDTIVDAMFGAGSHSVVWNAAAMSSGVYLIRVKNGLSVKSLPVTLMK
ncbi:T9SS type A sorting domain-containing protein, partial [Candidatus Omnitrophota bacterium]